MAFGALVGAVVWMLGPPGSPTMLGLLVGFDAGALAYVSLIWTTLVAASPDVLRQHAAEDDPGRLPVFAVAIGSGLVIIVAALATAQSGRALGDVTRESLLGLTLSAATLAWLMTHSAFALRYVHLHFGAIPPGGGDDAGGFRFPGHDHPDGLDFLYLAFTVGMTFQVSDLQVRDRRCRRAVLAQGLLSFAYNTVIIALVLNLVLSGAQTGRT